METIGLTVYVDWIKVKYTKKYDEHKTAEFSCCLVNGIYTFDYTKFINIVLYPA